jgi:chromate transporter
MTAPRGYVEKTPLSELGGLFFRLGATAFGGPAAHIAMMQDEVVRRRGWLSEEQFLDLLGATNLIPGPNSTEMAIHIGWARRRWAGLLVAGISFIVPAMVLTAALGWAYVRFGSVPTAGWLLYGVKPVMLGVMARAIGGLWPAAARESWLKVIGAFALVLAWLGVHELLVLVSAAAAAGARARVKERSSGGSASSGVPPALLGPLLPWASAAAAPVVSLHSIFWVFLKIGSVLFGSGYVLLAFLRAELVERAHWLSESQLLDAIAVGQVTPGPVFTTATFIGYVLARWPGAAIATLGIFLPAFVFVALSGPLVPRLRASKLAGALLDGVNVASLALMVLVTIELGRAALVDLGSWSIGIVSAIVLVRYNLNATWLILGGATLGYLLRATGLAGG